MINNLSIDSGGIYGYNYIGALKYLYEENLLNDLKNILGSSVGSIISLMICLKYNIHDIILLGENIDFGDFINQDNNLLDITNNLGYDIGKKLNKFIQSIIKIKCKKINLTFKELYEFNNILFTVIGSNLSNNKPTYFNKIDFPDMNVWEAIRISCNIPLLFCPYKYKDNYYADGAMNSCCTNYFNSDYNSLGLSISNPYNEFEDNNLNNFYDYIKILLYYPIKQLKSNNLNKNNNIALYSKKFIKIDNKLFLTLDEKKKLINYGYDKTKELIPNILKYFENHPLNPINLKLKISSSSEKNNNEMIENKDKINIIDDNNIINDKINNIEDNIKDNEQI